ncbi:hypothetical protein, partial [Salmonella sp. NW869]|uniref:hypothetical protein n=1 Tax=Salmonella sp. NW869 TaxID=2948347 RepID=UPI003F420C27
SLKTSIKTITYLSDIGCLEIQGASLVPVLIFTFSGRVQFARMFRAYGGVVKITIINSIFGCELYPPDY